MRVERIGVAPDRQTTEFVLPWPPAMNHIWRSVVIGGAPRVLLAKAGREYREVVRRAIGPCRPLQGRLAVSLEVVPPDRRRRDVDGVPKCLFDALTHAGVWSDDSQIDELWIRRMPPEPGGRVRVVVKEIGT